MDINKSIFNDKSISTNQLKLFYSVANEAIAIFTPKQGCIDMNPQFLELFQYDREDVIGMPEINFISQEYHDLYREMVFIEDDRPCKCNLLKCDNTIFTGFISVKTSRYEGKEIQILSCHDISEMRELDEKPDTRFEEYETIFDNGLVGILLIQNGRIVQRTNMAFAKMMGYSSAEEMIGMDVSRFHLSKLNFQTFNESFYSALVKKEPVKFDYKLKKRNGQPTWVSISGSVLAKSGQSNNENNIIWVVDDISQRKEAEEKLIKISRTDALTEIANRRYFIDQATRELEIHKRHKRNLSLLMIDIDNFKVINDTYGHSIGDDALCHFTQVCNQTIRISDIFGRLGGEEFSVLLLETNLEEAVVIAERIRTNIMESTAHEDNPIPPMTISIGAITMSLDQTVDDALKHADTLLYEAKNNGRNQVKY